MRKAGFWATVIICVVVVATTIAYLFVPGFLKPDREMKFGGVLFIIDDYYSFAIPNDEFGYANVPIESVSIKIRTDELHTATIKLINRHGPLSNNYDAAIIFVPNEYEAWKLRKRLHDLVNSRDRRPYNSEYY